MIVAGVDLPGAAVSKKSVAEVGKVCKVVHDPWGNARIRLTQQWQPEGLVLEGKEWKQ